MSAPTPKQSRSCAGALRPTGIMPSRIFCSPLRWRCLGRGTRRGPLCRPDLRSNGASPSARSAPKHRAMIRISSPNASASTRVCASPECRKSNVRCGFPRRTRRPGIGKHFALRPIITAIGGGNETLDRECRRNLADLLSGRCERAGELRSDTKRTVAHRLLPWPKSVLSWTIGSCRCQSARAIRRRVVSGNYRNRASETQTTSATIKA